MRLDKVEKYDRERILVNLEEARPNTKYKLYLVFGRTSSRFTKIRSRSYL